MRKNCRLFEQRTDLMLIVISSFINPRLRSTKEHTVAESNLILMSNSWCWSNTQIHKYTNTLCLCKASGVAFWRCCGGVAELVGAFPVDESVDCKRKRIHIESQYKYTRTWEIQIHIQNANSNTTTNINTNTNTITNTNKQKYKYKRRGGTGN